MMTSFSRVCRLRVPVAVMAVAGVLAMCVPAHAVKVTNGATVLFEDSYESVADDIPSVASTGTWIKTQGTPMTAENASPPGPFELLQYGRTSGSQSRNFAGFTAVQSNAGDLIRVEWMSYYDSASSPDEVNQALFQNNDGTTTGNEIMDIFWDGNTIQHYAGCGLCDLTPVLNIVKDQWIPVILEYEVGASTFSMTYNGVTGTGDAGNPSGTVGSFYVKNGGGTLYYVDAVPEPSTCALTLIGLLTLVGCRGRRRAR